VRRSLIDARRMESLALRVLLGLACAVPLALMTWRLRSHRGRAARCAAAALAFAVGCSGDPLTFALKQVDGRMVRSLCGN